MSSSDLLLEKVKNFLKALPITNKKNFQKLNIFLKSTKLYQNASDVYLLVPNMIVKQYLEREDYLNLIISAFNECMHSQCNVYVVLSKNFSLSSLKEIRKEDQINKNSGNLKKEQKVPSKVTKKHIIKEENELDESFDLTSNVSTNDYDCRQQESNSTYEFIAQPEESFINEESTSKQYKISYESDNQENASYMLQPEYENSEETVEEPKIKNERKFVGSYRTLTDSQIQENRFFKIHSIDSSKRFDNFVEGPTNEKLCNSGKLIAKTPGNPDRNPFFVYGDSGLGKTHILFAIGNAILKEQPHLKVMYVNMSTWITDYHMALNEHYSNNDKSLKLLTQFKTLYRNIDVLLFDDMQEIVKRETNQKMLSSELIDLMNDVSLKGCQLVFASNIHPQDMLNVEGPLRNRFQSGVCIKVEPPDYETRRRIVELKAKEMNLDLEPKSIDFIAYKMQTNVRTLEGYIKTIGAYCINMRGRISVDVVKDALHDVLAGKEKLLTVDNIKKTVAEYYKITVKDIDSSARPASIAHPRMMAMYLARELTNKSFPILGKEFGGKDHSTVMNAKKRIEKLIATNQKYREDYDNLKLQLV